MCGTYLIFLKLGFNVSLFDAHVNPFNYILFYVSLRNLVHYITYELLQFVEFSDARSAADSLTLVIVGRLRNLRLDCSIGDCTSYFTLYSHFEPAIPTLHKTSEILSHVDCI